MKGLTGWLEQNGWLRRREVRWPTRRVWLLAGLCGVMLAWVGVTRVHGFFACQHPITAEVLIVEGWLPDYALEAALQEFRRGDYRLLITTGVAVERGARLQAYGNYADLAKAVLVEKGLPADRIQAVPAPDVERDRTVQSAVAVARWREGQPTPFARANLVSRGVHSRRSWAVYRRVLGIEVGVMSVADQTYDPERWWRSSQGFKTVLEAVVSYCYNLVRL